MLCLFSLLSQLFSLKPTTSGAPTLEATFDPTLTAPLCSLRFSACTAPLSLLEGSANNVEPNQLGRRASNTIDDCEDGTLSEYPRDEAIQWLRIVSLDPTDQPWSLPLRIGGKAKIVAGLKAWLGDPTRDRADFYYSSDVGQPSWTYLNTAQIESELIDDDGFGIFESGSFIIADVAQSIHAIRVNFRYRGRRSQCSGGQYSDTDDLAFYVMPNV